MFFEKAVLGLEKVVLVLKK